VLPHQSSRSAAAHQRTGVADDRTGTPEAFGEQILVIAAEVGAAAGSGSWCETVDTRVDG
jgi:hypothetical protein